MRTLVKLIWAVPVARYILIALILAAIVIGVYEFIKEGQEAEKLKQKDREYGDSIWKD